MGFAARSLARSRWFAVVAVLTLAIGTSATSLMFTLVEGVLLRPLPVREQDRLVVVEKRLPSGSRTLWPISRSEIEAIGADSRLLESVAGVTWNAVSPDSVADGGSEFSLATGYVTGSFFDVLGAEPVLGRALVRADDLPGAENVLVLSHAAWRGRFGASPEVIGRRVVLGEQPFRIVGVMPPDLELPRGVEAWMTVTACQTTTTNPTFQRAMETELKLLSRLRSGVTLRQARGELEGLFRELDSVAERRGRGEAKPALQALDEVMVGDVRQPLLVLFAAVGLVLLIASANVANLLLLRSESRRAAVAVRAAIGATPWRIALQLVAEAALLATAAAAVGLGVTPLALRGVLAVLPGSLPRVEAVRLDAGVVLFGTALAFVTAALSLLPALTSGRVDLVTALAGGRTAGAGRVAQRGRRTLVVAQVALAVAVVAGASVLARSLARLEAADTGMASDRIVFLSLALPPAKYADGERLLTFLNAAVARVESVPGVERATPVNTTPFSGTGGWDAPRFAADHQDPEQAASNPALNLEAVYPGYFSTLGIAIERGRAFRESDRRGAPDVVILSRDVADRLWPGEDPIGRRIVFGGPDSGDGWRRVVGVVAPTRYREYADPRPTVYVPAEQLMVSARLLAVRSVLPPGAVAGSAGEALEELDAGVRVNGVAPYVELLRRPLARPRFDALLSGLFALAALLLATVGLYAVVSAWVRQRNPELAVRVALGATPGDLRRLVLREGLGLAGLGAILGVAGALAAGRALESLVFGARGVDLWSPAGAAVLLVALSGLACVPPTRLAARLDVLALLRRP